MNGDGEDMRYPAPEKAEIIHLVEQSHLSAKRSLEMEERFSFDPLTSKSLPKSAFQVLLILR
jgi:hypothetical protein